MQAVILAAGMGRRLGELTAGKAKCMVEVGGTTLIARMLGQLEGLGLSRIILVTGCHGEELRRYVESLGLATPVRYLHNGDYAATNNIYSLFLAREYLLEEDSLLLESDLIFEDGALSALVEDPYPTLALAARYESWMDGTVLRLDGEGNILGLYDGKSFPLSRAGEFCKTVNLYKFSREFSRNRYVPFLEAYCQALGRSQYYEQVLRVISLLEDPGIKAKVLEGVLWYEIDDPQDLDIARSLFAPTPGERLRRLEKRYGGFWRYPGLLDFCYLVNPFFPTPRLLEELAAALPRLTADYPSGLEVNRGLMGRLFGLPPELVLPGNGAAELIRSLLPLLPGKKGIIRPAFEEYPARMAPGEAVEYFPQGPGFAYTAGELMDFFGGKGLSALILVNPDNPSGHFLPRREVERLIAWAGEEGLRLVVDESFADFASEEGASLLERGLLEENPQLLVVKSISKSYGVAGLRLGVLAGSDRELLSAAAKDLSIWNINSFGEYFLQTAAKYREDYREAMARFRKVREDFYLRLKALPGLEVFPSEANYFLCRLAAGRSARALAEELLSRRRILVKDLSGKRGIPGEYLRLAVKTPEENQKLLEALGEALD